MTISLLIFMSACTPKYTCKQARTHCAECLLPASGIVTVPASVMERNLPMSCLILIKRDPYINKVYKTGNAGADLRNVAQSYRKATDDNIKIENEMKTACLKDLDASDLSAEESAETYCRNLELVYSKEKMACLPGTENQ